MSRGILVNNYALIYIKYVIKFKIIRICHRVYMFLPKDYIDLQWRLIYHDYVLVLYCVELCPLDLTS